eukprot:1156850-Pelagomonas_calceolata.AAC.10
MCRPQEQEMVQAGMPVQGAGGYQTPCPCTQPHQPRLRDPLTEAPCSANYPLPFPPLQQGPQLTLINQAFTKALSAPPSALRSQEQCSGFTAGCSWLWQDAHIL